MKKTKFYHYVTPIFFGDVDIEKVLVSNKISLGEKTISILLVTFNANADIKKEFDSEPVYNRN